MINAWWLVIVSFAWLVLLVWIQRMSYRHGVWDGAFNHFMPQVQKEMLYYDRHRATRILRQEGLLDPEDTPEAS